MWDFVCYEKRNDRKKKGKGRGKLCGSFPMDGDEMDKRRDWDLKKGVLGVVERGIVESAMKTCFSRVTWTT